MCVTIPFLNSFITNLFIENVPFYSLVKYISEEIDSVLDVKHQKLVFLVNNMEDKRVLWDTARSFTIDPSVFIHCNFATTLIEEARSASNNESVLVPVMNMLLEHGKNFVRSAF